MLWLGCRDPARVCQFMSLSTCVCVWYSFHARVYLEVRGVPVGRSNTGLFHKWADVREEKKDERNIFNPNLSVVFSFLQSLSGFCCSLLVFPFHPLYLPVNHTHTNTHALTSGGLPSDLLLLPSVVWLLTWTSDLFFVGSRGPGCIVHHLPLWLSHLDRLNVH